MQFLSVIGLTGGIATGKTTVSELFAQQGVAIVDSDAIAHSVIQPRKSAYKKIVATFGKSILAPDGTIDRAKLGSIIFNDPEARSKLNSITHPKIIYEMIKQTIFHFLLLRLVIVWNTPLLIETNLHKLCKCVVVVFAEPETQLERLMKRNSLTFEEAISRINAQMLIHDKCRLADFVINNNGDLASTSSQVAVILDKLRSRHWLAQKVFRVFLISAALLPIFFVVKLAIFSLIKLI
ncbi:hypothetical protein RCL1_007201 [Eukaryota sp. TZLM3-RCL]